MIRWSQVQDPWSLLDDIAGFQTDFNRLLGGRGYRNAGARYPRLNIWTSDEEAVVDALLPGADPSDVDVSVEGDLLKISGCVRGAGDSEGETRKVEIPAGEFSRSVRLPFRAEAGKVEAKYTNGLLRLSIPRAEEDKPKKIEITSD
jgi:HSP20 family protein